MQNKTALPGHLMEKIVKDHLDPLEAARIGLALGLDIPTEYNAKFQHFAENIDVVAEAEIDTTIKAMAAGRPITGTAHLEHTNLKINNKRYLASFALTYRYVGKSKKSIQLVSATVNLRPLDTTVNAVEAVAKAAEAAATLSIKVEDMKLEVRNVHHIYHFPNPNPALSPLPPKSFLLDTPPEAFYELYVYLRWAILIAAHLQNGTSRTHGQHDIVRTTKLRVKHMTIFGVKNIVYNIDEKQNKAFLSNLDEKFTKWYSVVTSKPSKPLSRKKRTVEPVPPLQKINAKIKLSLGGGLRRVYVDARGNSFVKLLGSFTSFSHDDVVDAMMVDLNKVR